MSSTKWVLERKLIELTGLTKDQIRIRRKLWVYGRQYRKATDGCIWYNLEEIDRWVEKGWAA